MSESAVAVRDIRKSYGALEVLKGITLEARTSEVISIVGASGSGKSTLLRCIPLLEVPDVGDVSVGGEWLQWRPTGSRRVPADKAQVSRLRSRLGFVFQSFNLWSHMTVLGNVIEAPVHVQRRPRAEAVEEAQVLLAKVGLADKASVASASNHRRPEIR